MPQNEQTDSQQLIPSDTEGLRQTVALLDYRMNTHRHNKVDLTQPVDQRDRPNVLTDAASILVDATQGKFYTVTLTGNRTLANPTGAHDGQTFIFEVIQDGTGSRTLAYGSKFAFGTTIASVTLTTTANKRDFIGAIYRATTDKFYIVAFSNGY